MRLFRDSPAGPVPSGEAEGTALLASGTLLGRIIAFLARLLVWQGKVFEPERGRLRNRVTPLRILALPALVRRGPSRVDGRDCILVEYTRLSRLVGRLDDEIRMVSPGLYLGMAFWRGLHMTTFSLRFGDESADGDIGVGSAVRDIGDAVRDTEQR
ncbi:hypothetical protein ABZ860_13285 [Microbispora sp. NPDC046973]|uniref:hypothetical protein n=1 Tax=Microbispora sp. NPDC046973 TaxID=3155022 RepID=UPI0033DAE0C9